MATQGILSVLERCGDPSNDKVIYKIIAGCDGNSSNVQQLASKLLEHFKQQKSLSGLDEIYAIAGRYVGCKECLVVMNSKDALYKGEGDLDKRYRETFHIPYFNPRWESGIASTSETIIFTKKERNIKAKEEAMPARGEEEPKDVQIANLLKKNKELAEKLAEYKCLGTLEAIKKLRARADAWKLLYEEDVITPEIAEAYLIRACIFTKAEKFLDEIIAEDAKMNKEKEKEGEGKKTAYLLLCHRRADAMFKGKLHEFKGLENELEAVNMLIKRIYPLGELRSTQVIASIVTKYVTLKKDPWVKLMFNDELIARKLYEFLPCGAAIIHNEIRLKGSDIEFDRKSLLNEAEKSFDKIIPNWKDNLIWICGG